jgi:Uma2 family endonuclease
MSARLKPYISPQAYLAAERAGEIKHEYHDGQVYAMAGASERHNLIAMNIGASLHSQLRRRACTVYPSDLRVKVSPLGFYTYPDISVVCGAPQFEEARRDTLLNPAVIVEVLSPSTEGYDRGRKFQFYRALPSLHEYMLVAQESLHIEHYTRQPDGRWVLVESDQPDARFQLATIDCTLTAADVYEKVIFDAADPDEPLAHD